MREFREVVYRLRRKAKDRSPSLVAGLVGAGARVQTQTLATNLDARGNVWRLVQVRGMASQLAQVDRAFARRIPVVLERRVLARGPSHRVLWYKYTKQRGGQGPSLTELALRLLGPETIVTDRTVGDELEVTVITQPGPALKRFLVELPAAASVQHEFRLLHVGRPRPATGPAMSSTEEEALLAAQAMGLFGVPRRGSMRALAAQLGCSASAASARLRRAQAKLAAAYAGA